MRKLNKCSRLTRVGVFVYGEQGQVGIRTSTFCVLEKEELPELQIEDIVTDHYCEQVQSLFEELSSRE